MDLNCELQKESAKESDHTTLKVISSANRKVINKFNVHETQINNFYVFAFVFIRCERTFVRDDRKT